METPYEILGVDEDADDDAIKKAYLGKVREFPPEHQPDAFQRIREAYERVATDRLRREYRLFHRAPPDPAPLLRLALKPGAAARPDTATLTAALADCANAWLARQEQSE